MRARIEATLQCDRDLLPDYEDGMPVCMEKTAGYLVICSGTVREIVRISSRSGASAQEVQVIQPLQVGVRHPGWAVIARAGTTYVLCPAHAVEGRKLLDGREIG